MHKNENTPDDQPVSRPAAMRLKPEPFLACLVWFGDDTQTSEAGKVSIEGDSFAIRQIRDKERVVTLLLV